MHGQQNIKLNISYYDINCTNIVTLKEQETYKMDINFFVCENYLKYHRVFKLICKYSGFSNSQNSVMSQLYRVVGAFETHEM
jgi:hypothetical protein